MAYLLGLFLVISLHVAFLLAYVYGTYICFSKKWYLGVTALIVPGFALVVGVAKLFKRDLLK